MNSSAWVTLATNDTYSLGALVVAYSLKKVETVHQLVVLITPGVSDAMKNKLQSVFDLVQEVNVLDSQDATNLAVLKRPELGITFTKLHCWNLTQFNKCVFLDADVLVLKNCDELFEREELSAAPDVGWPDCFNSGVFVFKPSAETFGKLIQFAEASGSFDGGDQGILNSFFSDWATSDSSKRLPFLYNTASTATYSYMPAFNQFRVNIKIIHFIGATKPWTLFFDPKSKSVESPIGYNHLQEFLQFWWNLFVENVHPTLSSEMSGIAGALATLQLGTLEDQTALENQYRRYSWESGQIDYLGRDAFSNIWSKIQETIDEVPVPQEPVVVPAVVSQVQAAPVPATKVVAAVSEEASPAIVVQKVEASVQKKPAANKEVKKPTKTAKKEGEDTPKI